jgi:hypothetical protein
MIHVWGARLPAAAQAMNFGFAAIISVVQLYEYLDSVLLRHEVLGTTAATCDHQHRILSWPGRIWRMALE